MRCQDIPTRKDFFNNIGPSPMCSVEPELFAFGGAQRLADTTLAAGPR